MNITKEFITSVSINDAAVKNGAGLVKKKSFIKLAVDKDGALLFGECAGSGKNPYFCSADFSNDASPVFRCSCPSRQIPCKHVIGLMWAYAEGLPFNTEDIPQDIITKRENSEKRAVKVKEKREKAESAKPKEKSAAWKKSAVKKIEAQLAGIDEAVKILTSITALGLGSLDAKNIREYEGIVKQLDSYFIPGIQNEINDLIGMARDNSAKSTNSQDHFMPMALKLCQTNTLLTKSKAYLENKKSAPDKPDTESEIEELTGYAWKLEELAQHHLFETDAQLAQLCFHIRQEDDKKQYVDEGFYISLQSGKIYRTRNYRPYKAVKYIREEDSVSGVIQVPRLYIYPSLSLNPRVRWEESAIQTFRDYTPEDYSVILSHANPNVSETIKTVKNQLKDLLLFPHPVALVRFARLGKLEKTENSPGKFVIYDHTGSAVCLKQSAYCHNSFMFLLDMLAKPETENNAMLLLFENSVETGELFAQPLALVTGSRIIRLVY